MMALRHPLPQPCWIKLLLPVYWWVKIPAAVPRLRSTFTSELESRPISLPVHAFGSGRLRKQALIIAHERMIGMCGCPCLLGSHHVVTLLRRPCE